MTLAQINGFVKAASVVMSQEMLNEMSGARVAYHADEKDYSKVVKDLQRDM